MNLETAWKTAYCRQLQDAKGLFYARVDPCSEVSVQMNLCVHAHTTSRHVASNVYTMMMWFPFWKIK